MVGPAKTRTFRIKFLAVFTIVVILLMSVGNINFVEMYGGIIATLAVGMIAIFIAQHVLFRKNVSVVDTSDMILGVIILIAWTLLFLYNGTKVSYERHAWIK